MKNVTAKIFSLSLFVFLVLHFAFFVFAQQVKEPNVAGSFYPADPKVLSKLIDGFLMLAESQPLSEKIFALICPHAGYAFSGQTAAFAYKLLQGRSYKTVVIIAPKHEGLDGIAVYPQGIFRTPLGDLEIDREFTQQLSTAGGVVFIPELFSNEHSLEVQLPFLQKVLAKSELGDPWHSTKYDFKIVPILIGDISLTACQKLAHTLQKVIGERTDVLIIASTDLYHGYDYDQAEQIDTQTLKFIRTMDPLGLYDGLRAGRLQMCGGSGVVVTLILARESGYDQAVILQQTNSAMVTGKKIKGVWTVGYASCAIISDNSLLSESKDKQSADFKEGDRQMLNQEQRKRLLEISRQSIETYLKTRKKLVVQETDPQLNKALGAFVTLQKQGELRGCIGNLIASQPLFLTIKDMAVEAAVGDPRFPPLVLAELKDIKIEISVLSALERIESPEKIKLGTHGVLIKRGFQSGVFLPQVATETGWSKEEFLSYLCAHKAGLPADAWKDKNTEIYIFTAEVFSE